MEIDSDETDTEPEPELHRDPSIPAAPVCPPPGSPPLSELSSEALIAKLQTNQSSLESWMMAANRLQTRYEDFQRQMLAIKTNLKTQEKATRTAVAQRDRAIADKERIITEKDDVVEQLTIALASLKAGNSEMHALVVENSDLKTQVSVLGKKLEAAEKEAGFAREQYQNASNAAFAIRKEMDEMQGANEHLKRLADERVVALQKGRQDEAIRMRDEMIGDLESKLKERDERIKRLEMMPVAPTPRRGVVGTRSGSVPRSVASRHSSPRV